MPIDFKITLNKDKQSLMLCLRTKEQCQIQGQHVAHSPSPTTKALADGVTRDPLPETVIPPRAKHMMEGGK